MHPMKNKRIDRQYLKLLDLVVTPEWSSQEDELAFACLQESSSNGVNFSTKHHHRKHTKHRNVQSDRPDTQRE